MFYCKSNVISSLSIVCIFFLFWNKPWWSIVKTVENLIFALSKEMCLFTSLTSNGTERLIILSRQSPIELFKRAQSIQCLTRELRRNVMIAIRQTTCHSKKKKKQRKANSKSILQQLYYVLRWKFETLREEWVIVSSLRHHGVLVGSIFDRRSRLLICRWRGIRFVRFNYGSQSLSDCNWIIRRCLLHFDCKYLY